MCISKPAQRGFFAKVGDQRHGHLRLVHANAYEVTGDTRLGNFEQGGTDSKAIANANFGVGQAIDGKVFTKLSVR